MCLTTASVQADREPSSVKTGMLEELNLLLGSEEKCIALSHASRFGKSRAASMINAYYSLGSDSKELVSSFSVQE